MIAYRTRGPVDDVTLSQLHAAAFGETPRLRPWAQRLTDHSLTWVTAHDGPRLVGFVNVAWDGDQHAFLLDAVVAPPRRHAGIGTELVTAAVREATASGCAWLHVDFAARLDPFFAAAGFGPTGSGLLRLHR